MIKTELPEKSKSHEAVIHEIRDVIVENYADKVAFVILFGSFARGDWVHDYYTEEGYDLEYASDYDFLVITKKAKTGSGYQATKFRDDIEAKLKSFQFPNKPHKPAIIVESLARVNDDLEKGQYFFSDIKKEGILLYHDQEFELAEPRQLSSDEAREIAKNDFDRWFNKGDDFLQDSYSALKAKRNNNAAFYLHQTTESFLTCALLVLTGYKPKSHDIKYFLSLASSQSNKFLNTFPLINKEQKNCFELLRKAYIDSRYSKDYKITKEQLGYLIKRVEYLQNVTQEVCKEKVKLIHLQTNI
jgi:uncharacterized protein